MINICIHGHFYQPPRENPWTGEIELQPGAAPYHDWNEKIFDECYLPNTEAQIINDTGEVVAKINNYELINFNFGPNLLAWIKRKHPETYKKITGSDRKSMAEHNGHGNAIAMCYSHMIMPLANLNDKITQVKWGLADFKYHFGRDSEGIWLPETACNTDTLEVLINESVKYIILDSQQAERVKPITDNEWTDVSSGSINPKIPYRWFSEFNKKKYIDIFFYDGPVSKSVAFDDVLASSQNLLGKIFAAEDKEIPGDQLISVAADGETFGHHKKSAERTLAFFLTSLAPANNFSIVNFGEYLDLHTPEYEVKIKPGEGTSWSCPHGVKRWMDDCGCGGGEGWNQKWRKPLREAMNWLRDELILIYDKHGSPFLKNIWNARNNYINVILNDNYEVKKEFIRTHCINHSSAAEAETVFKLLEMQKYSMLMFTSCGWFFSEISGIETVKIMEYASRAIEIARDITSENLENEFLNRLFKAKSNLPMFRNGKNIYLLHVKKINSE